MVILFVNFFLNSGVIGGYNLQKQHTLMNIEKLKLKTHLLYLLIERLNYQIGKMIWISNFYLTLHLFVMQIFCLRIYVHGDALSSIITLNIQISTFFGKDIYKNESLLQSTPVTTQISSNLPVMIISDSTMNMSSGC